MTNDNTPLEGLGDDFEIDLGLADESKSDDIELNLDFGEDEEKAADEVVLDLGQDEEPAADDDISLTDDEASDEAEVDHAEAALAELRARLEGQFGDWYVIHTYSGMENRVKQNVDARVLTLGMEDYIFETVVPTEDITEIRNGARKKVTRTSHPGYVLVRMDMTNESWAAVRHTPSVTGFVGQGNTPVPLTLEEVESMLAPAAIAQAAAAAAEPSPSARKKVEVADFAVGDSVMVVAGSFSGVHATITEINVNNQRLKALVEILGRETPVDLSFAQVQKD